MLCAWSPAEAVGTVRDPCWQCPDLAWRARPCAAGYSGGQPRDCQPPGSGGRVPGWPFWPGSRSRRPCAAAGGQPAGLGPVHTCACISGELDEVSAGHDPPVHTPRLGYTELQLFTGVEITSWENAVPARAGVWNAAGPARRPSVLTWPDGPNTGTAPATRATSAACGCTWCAPCKGCPSPSAWPAPRLTSATCCPASWPPGRTCWLPGPARP